jgi:membrane protease YdiL (CAAX protease family)
MEIGILLAALRWWSGSLWAAVIGHAVNNGIAGAAFLLGIEDPDVPPPMWILALGAVLLVAGIVLLVRVLRRPSPAPAVEEPGAGTRAAVAGLTLAWGAAVVSGLRLLAQLWRRP